jgi:hypothetical protein
MAEQSDTPKLVSSDGTVIEGTREADGSVVFHGPMTFGRRAECACSPIFTGLTRPHKVIGRTINTRCPVHGVGAPPPRDVRAIAVDMREAAAVVELYGADAGAWRARMSELCREYLAGEGA